MIKQVYSAADHSNINVTPNAPGTTAGSPRTAGGTHSNTITINGAGVQAATAANIEELKDFLSFVASLNTQSEITINVNLDCSSQIVVAADGGTATLAKQQMASGKPQHL